MIVTKELLVRVEFTQKEIEDILKAHIAKTVPEVKKMMVSTTDLGRVDVGDVSCGSAIEFIDR